MAKIKKILREDEEPQEWEPPNWYYNYSGDPFITKKMWKDVDNNIKTGIHNFNILNLKCMGRYGIWPDWRRIDPELRKQYGLCEYGRSYASDWRLYKTMIQSNNFPFYSNMYGRDIIDPGERNKAYCITAYPFNWGNPWQGHSYWTDLDTLQAGSCYGEPWGNLKPYMVRENMQAYDGMRMEVTDQGYYDWVYAKVSQVCRTIKIKRI